LAAKAQCFILELDGLGPLVRDTKMVFEHSDISRDVAGGIGLEQSGSRLNRNALGSIVVPNTLARSSIWMQWRWSKLVNFWSSALLGSVTAVSAPPGIRTQNLRIKRWLSTVREWRTVR
jgi:hypothetical protein